MTKIAQGRYYGCVMHISFSKLPHYNKLFCDYCEDFSRTDGLYLHSPWEDSAFSARLEYLAGKKFDRKKVSEILVEQNRALGASLLALENAALLSEEKTAVVIGGQQAGLFGGPMYTLAKAASAVRWARRLAEKHPDWKFVPAFWIAADDHDFDEVKRLHWVGTDYAEHYCEFSPKADVAGFPVGGIKIDDGISEAFDCFFGTNPETEFTAGLKAALADAYKPGNTMAEAFGKFLAVFLADYGIVFIDPTDERLKAIGAPLFARAIEARDEIFSGVAARDKKLDALGYHKQLSLPEDGTNLLVSVNGRRESLREENGGFITESGAAFSMSELAKLIAEEPAKVSPNVVLRPVYQDTLLPVVASVVGPSELAYYAQISDAFDSFGMQPPVYLPRYSITVIEHRIESVLAETGLEWWECAGEKDDVITRVVRSKLPDTLDRDIEHFKREMEESTKWLASKVVAFEPTLATPLDKMAQGFANYADGIEKKVRQAYKQKNQVWVDRISRAITALFPARGLQERFFGPVYFANKYGSSVASKILDELDPSEPGHHTIVL